ncbi:MAG TPA: TolC family protein [Longimicrobiaceae bacterium]|nr:TolC family protein [Longimicrobiaceae bacterium]
MKHSLLLLVVLVAGSEPLLAQEPTPVPAELTLEAALRIARERNPAYAVQTARLAAADAAERTVDSWLRYIPTLSFGLNASVTQARTPTGTDEFGRPIKLDEPLTFRRTDSAMGPSFGQITLFDGGRSLRQARSTRAGVRGTRAQIAAESIQLESQLVRGYFTAVRMERQVELDEHLLESTRLNFEAAQRLLRVGTQDALDVLNAELAVARAEHRLEQTRGEVRKSRLALTEAMGIGREVAFALADELPEVTDPSSLDIDLLVASAATGNPALAQLDAAAQQSRYELLDSRFARWPTLSVVMSTRSGFQGSGADPLFYLNPLNQTYTVGLNVGISLFDRFQASNRVAQARAGYAGVTESLRARRFQIETEVRQTFIDLENLYRTLTLQQRTADLARERLDLSQQKYRLGTLSFRELQDAVDVAYQAEYDALAARFDFAEARVTLEEQIGRRLP